MLYLKFECSSCHTLFSYSGNDILNRSELSCPQCNLKLSSSVLKRLQSNIRFFEKSSTFSISITPSPSIKMGDMIQNARDHNWTLHLSRSFPKLLKPDLTAIEVFPYNPFHCNVPPTDLCILFYTLKSLFLTS